MRDMDPEVLASLINMLSSRRQREEDKSRIGQPGWDLPKDRIAMANLDLDEGEWEAKK